MEREGVRAVARRTLTVAAVVLLALGVWLAAGTVHPRSDDEVPAPVWTPIPRDGGGLHA